MKVSNRHSKIWWKILFSAVLLLSGCVVPKDHGSIIGKQQYQGVNTSRGNGQASSGNIPPPVEHSALGTLPQGKEKRVALVIGNGAYGDDLTLDNPPNDAYDLATALKKLGFNVIHQENVRTKQEMKKILQTFAQQLEGATLGLFFYAGHGVQYQGENYMVLTAFSSEDSSIKSVAKQSVTVDPILVTMEETNIPTKIVILDACRNNPFQGGLATMQSKTRYGGGTFIAYSTQPGNVALDGEERNSPYTSSLLQFLDQPNLPIEMLFKKVATAVSEKTNGEQIPWVSSALLGGDLCLAGCFSATAQEVGYCTTRVGKGLYQGQCQEGRPHGQGVMKYQSGEYYKGSFVNGLRHGRGVQYLSDGTEIAGQFCNGRLCD